MKQVFFIWILQFIFSLTNAQTINNKYQILTEKQTDSIFTDKVKADLGIDYTIFRAYHYKDLSGEHYLLLTERAYKRQNGEPLNDTVKAINLKKQDGKLSIDWILRDFIMAKNKADSPEYSIWFWTKYFDLQDFDGDGLIDPVVVYGTSGNNDTEDGRIKILIYYKGQKLAVRHQNGPLDFQRNTQVDAKFYDLPKQMQDYIKGLMDKMTENNNAIFPYGYKEKMDAKKTYFDESK